MLVFGERENRSTRRKTSRNRVGNQQTQPTYGTEGEGRGGNRSTRRKTSRSRVGNQQTQPTYGTEGEGRGENRSTRRKTSRNRVGNQQTQPTYDAESGNRTRDTLVEGERSHHYANMQLTTVAPYTWSPVQSLSAKVSHRAYHKALNKITQFWLVKTPQLLEIVLRRKRFHGNDASAQPSMGNFNFCRVQLDKIQICPSSLGTWVAYTLRVSLWSDWLDFQITELLQNEHPWITVAMVTAVAWKPMRK